MCGQFFVEHDRYLVCSVLFSGRSQLQGRLQTIYVVHQNDINWGLSHKKFTPVICVSHSMFVCKFARVIRVSHSMFVNLLQIVACMQTRSRFSLCMYDTSSDNRTNGLVDGWKHELERWMDGWIDGLNGCNIMWKIIGSWIFMDLVYRGLYPGDLWMDVYSVLVENGCNIMWKIHRIISSAIHLPTLNYRSQPSMGHIWYLSTSNYRGSHPSDWAWTISTAILVDKSWDISPDHQSGHIKLSPQPSIWHIELSPPPISHPSDTFNYLLSHPSDLPNWTNCHRHRISALRIVSQLFRTQYFPRWMEIIIVTPIFKKGAPSDPKNYHPIALTCTALQNFWIADLVGNTGSFKFVQTYYTPPTRFSKKTLNSHQPAWVHKWLVTFFIRRHSVDIAYIDFCRAFDAISHSNFYLNHRK